MIIDKALLFSDDQAITATAASTVKVTKAKAGGPHDEVWLYVKVGGVVFNTLTSLMIALQTSDTAAFTVATVLYQKSFLLAALDAINTELIKVIVPQGVLEYLRMYYTVTGTDPTTGTIWAGLVTDVKVGF